MNRSYRNVWNEAVGAWVAAPESAKGHGKSARQAVRRGAAMLLATAWMLAVPAQAACNDGTGGPNGVVFANGGSTCHATLGSYSGANVGHALGDGSVLIFDQNVTLSSGVANAQVLGVGGANGLGSSPAAIVHATGDLTAVASNSTSGSVTRPVYIYAGSNGSGTRSLLQVDGNLTATTQGGQGAALENAGGDIWVQGTTTLTTRVADAWRNNGGVGIFDGPVNLAVGVGGAGAGLRMSSGTLTFNKGYGALECLVRNLSAHGARLHFGETAAVPPRFDLRIAGDDRIRVAHVRWRTMQDVGVEFDPAGEAVSRSAA